MVQIEIQTKWYSRPNGTVDQMVLDQMVQQTKWQSRPTGSRPNGTRPTVVRPNSTASQRTYQVYRDVSDGGCGRTGGTSEMEGDIECMWQLCILP